MRNCQCLAVSTDSQYTHLAFAGIPKSDGGLGNKELLLVSDSSKDISLSFNVLKEDEGICYNSLFLFDEDRNLFYSQRSDFSVEISFEDALRIID